MVLTRRRLLCRALTAAPALLGVPSATTASTAASAGSALHALNRLAYGPCPGDLDAWARLTWDDLVEQQLSTGSLVPPAALQARLDAWNDAHRAMTLMQRVRAYREAERRANEGKDESARRELVQREMLHAAEARLARALWSPHPLEERLVEFWANHFNVFFGKGLCRVLVADYEARAIRPHVLGSFRAMLGATAKHPAMLFYLDNWLSTRESGNSPDGRGRQGLNENFARELMELHTLGVEGGYTQRDVTELAKVLTGWTLNPRAPGTGTDNEGFVFAPNRHEPGPKTWMGLAVPGRGQAQGEWVLDQLARHPATARRIAFKLAQHFVADAPPPELVQHVAATFLHTDGDLRATTRALLLHPAARAEPGSQFKTPYRFVLSLLRATAAPIDTVEGWQPVLQGLRGLGQPLFGCVTPDGWKVTREAWLDPEALARRSELATRLALRLRPEPERLLATLGPGIGELTRAAIATYPSRLQAALVLGSPDFNNA